MENREKEGEAFWYLQPAWLLLKEEYIRRCSYMCNHGGYSRLEFEKENIRNSIINELGVNGNRDYISKKILVLEKTLFDFLEELTQQKFKHYMWIPDFEERELRKRFNTALQAA